MCLLRCRNGLLLWDMGMGLLSNRLLHRPLKRHLSVSFVCVHMCPDKKLFQQFPTTADESCISAATNTRELVELIELVGRSFFSPYVAPRHWP